MTKTSTITSHDVWKLSHPVKRNLLRRFSPASKASAQTKYWTVEKCLFNRPGNSRFVGPAPVGKEVLRRGPLTNTNVWK